MDEENVERALYGVGVINITPAIGAHIGGDTGAGSVWCVRVTMTFGCCTSCNLPAAGVPDSISRSAMDFIFIRTSVEHAMHGQRPHHHRLWDDAG